MVIVERKSGVENRDQAEDEGDKPSQKQGCDRWEDSGLTSEFFHENESAILDDEIWRVSS